MRFLLVLFLSFTSFFELKAQVLPDSNILHLQAPATFQARFYTSQGNFEIEAYREWAPLGVDRLYQLIHSGFYTNMIIFRVVPGFVVQFGISGSDTLNDFWGGMPLKDDPVIQSNLKATLSYARDGADTRDAQLFINLEDNSRLDTVDYLGGIGFPPIGKVISGMDVVLSLFSEYKNDPAMEQDTMYLKGNAFIENKYPKLDRIYRTEITEIYGQPVEAPPYIYTVNGKILAEDLGLTLTHEHIFSNFGAEADQTSVYDREKLFAQVLPYLQEIKDLGVKSIFEPTTLNFGRRADFLKDLSYWTGLHIITNTGIYGAANDRYIPQWAYEASIDSIADTWIEEFETGIGGSGIRPGFIKLAFDNGEPSDIDEKLFRAGVRAHLQTGLTLTVHTGNNPEAVKLQLDILEENKVNPGAWVWIHANKCDSLELLLATAAKGAWISLDGIKTDPDILAWHIEALEAFKEKGLLNRVLLSHDGNSFPRGGAIRPYGALVNDLIPALKAKGFQEDELDLILKRNPGKAFAILVRPLPR